ncbi:MAG TPA: hypothetical protein VHG89_10285 [Verrucomicrobiae bacterium]|nr:hypothetical protein [Verrucomicrobiae bacterium]
MSMNIILQNKHNLEFIKTLRCNWTTHGADAHKFSNGMAAMMFCFHHRLPDMQMLALFGNSAISFTVPIANVYDANH